MIVSGNLVLPDLAGQDAVTVQKGWLEIDGPFIVRLEIGELHPKPDIGGEHVLISPGFIDVHAHIPQINALGAYGMQLLDWLDNVVFPAEAHWADPQFARSRSRDAFKQFLSCGTTGVFAFSANFREATLACLEEAQKIGMRAKIGQPLADMHIHPDLCKSTQGNLEDAQAALEAFPESTHKRVAAAIAPRFALTCSESLLRGAAQIANDSRAYIETHLAEMVPECERACELHNSNDYTSIYEKAGLVNERCFLGHGIHLSKDERRRLAASKAIIAHCPTSNTFLRSGTMHRERYLNDGIRVGLASDIAGGPDRSMIRVARAMMEASFHAEDSAPATTSEAWWQITQGNAERLGWQDAGILHEGATADLTVIDANPDWLKARDPLGYLIFTWDDRWLKKTLLRGQVVFQA